MSFDIGDRQVYFIYLGDISSKDLLGVPPRYILGKNNTDS